MRGTLREIRETPALLWVSVASAAVFGLAGYLWGAGVVWISTPYEVPEARMAGPMEVRHGQPLRIAFRIVRRRICQIDLDRFITELSTNETVWRQRVPGGSTPLGDAWVVLDIWVSGVELNPGRHVYRTTITNTCSDGIYVTQTPGVEFTLLPSPSAG